MKGEQVPVDATSLQRRTLLKRGLVIAGAGMLTTAGIATHLQLRDPKPPPFDPRTDTIHAAETSVEDLTRLQQLVDQSSRQGRSIRMVGHFSLNSGPLQIQEGTHLDASEATFQQTRPRTPVLNLHSRTTIFGGLIIGHGGDWENSSLVYVSAAIAIESGAQDVTLFGVSGIKLAGAGVFAPQGAHGLRILDCHWEGVGRAIPPETGQYSAGLVATGPIKNLEMRGGSISNFAHGVSTGAVSEFFIGAGLIITAKGQHGLYVGPSSNGEISGVLINDVPLQGVKVQIPPASPIGTSNIAITDSTIRNTGSHGVLVSNLSTSPRIFSRGIFIENLQMSQEMSKMGDAVVIMDVVTASISKMVVSGFARGIRVLRSRNIGVDNNRFTDYAAEAMYLEDVRDSRVESNAFIRTNDSQITPGKSTFLVNGTKSKQLTFIDNSIVDETHSTLNYFGGAPEAFVTLSAHGNYGFGATSGAFSSGIAVSPELSASNRFE